MESIKIRDIVETYENLSERQREKIIRIAERQIEEHGIAGFDSQYRYVAELVAKFQAVRENFMLRLDAPLQNHDGSGRMLHEIIADEKQGYDIIDKLNEAEYLLRGISLDAVAQLSGKFLDEKERELIHKLLDRSNGEERILFTPEEIVSGVPIIKRRLEILVKLMEEDKRFQQSERQVVYVNLSPDNPWIQWKPRRYNGRPIDFFMRHIDVYGKFVEEGRGALGRFDASLYQTLRKYKETLEDGRVVRQIELAIPSLKEREGRFGGAHSNPLKYYKENQDRFIGLSRNGLAQVDPSLAKMLYKNRVRLEDGREVSQMELAIPERIRYRPLPWIYTKYAPYINQILDAHKIYNKNAARAARELRKSTGLRLHQARISKIWNEYGLRADKKGYRLIYPAGIDDPVLYRVLEVCGLRWTGKIPEFTLPNP